MSAGVFPQVARLKHPSSLATLYVVSQQDVSERVMAQRNITQLHQGLLREILPQQVSE